MLIGGYTASLSAQSYITLGEVVAYQGSSSDDSLRNRKMTGLATPQDCYTACLITNDGYCFEFRYVTWLAFLAIDLVGG